MRYPYIIMNSANDISFIETFWSYKTYTHTGILQPHVLSYENTEEIMQPMWVMLCEYNRF